MGGGKTVTYKGHTVIHDAPETKMRMYKLLAAGMGAASDDGNEFTSDLDAGLFIRFLDTPERVVLEFTPEEHRTRGLQGDPLAIAWCEPSDVEA